MPLGAFWASLANASMICRRLGPHITALILLSTLLWKSLSSQPLLSTYSKPSLFLPVPFPLTLHCLRGTVMMHVQSLVQRICYIYINSHACTAVKCGCYWADCMVSLMLRLALSCSLGLEITNSCTIHERCNCNEVFEISSILLYAHIESGVRCKLAADFLLQRWWPRKPLSLVCNLCSATSVCISRRHNINKVALVWKGGATTLSAFY